MGGGAAIQGVIAAARSLVDVVWAREIETLPVDTPERRAAFEKRLREVLALIRDETIRRHYRDEMDERSGSFSSVARSIAVPNEKGRCGQSRASHCRDATEPKCSCNHAAPRA